MTSGYADQRRASQRALDLGKRQGWDRDRHPIAEEIEAAVKEEREACARVARTVHQFQGIPSTTQEGFDRGYRMAGADIAEAIEARGDD